MTLRTTSELRDYADNPASSGFVPIHPTTLRSIADELDSLRERLARSSKDAQLLSLRAQLEALVAEREALVLQSRRLTDYGDLARARHQLRDIGARIQIVEKIAGGLQ